MAGRVVVLGSINVDLNIGLRCFPLPGETVVASRLSQGHGGKGANQAVSAARAGAEVVLLGAVGSDAFGAAALAALAAEGVGTERVERLPGPTGLALVLVDETGENEIVAVPGANALADGRGFGWRDDDVALTVFEVPLEAIEAFLTEARRGGARTVVNAAPATPMGSRALPLCDVLCVNEAELAALGHPSTASLVVTRGRNGARVIHDSESITLPGHAVDVVDTVGAGDVLTGVLAAGLAAGLDVFAAAARGNAAAALSVGRAGARSAPTAQEIDEFLKGSSCR